MVLLVNYVCKIWNPKRSRKFTRNIIFDQIMIYSQIYKFFLRTSNLKMLVLYWKFLWIWIFQVQVSLFLGGPFHKCQKRKKITFDYEKKNIWKAGLTWKFLTPSTCPRPLLICSSRETLLLSAVHRSSWRMHSSPLPRSSRCLKQTRALPAAAAQNFLHPKLCQVQTQQAHFRK